MKFTFISILILVFPFTAFLQVTDTLNMESCRVFLPSIHKQYDLLDPIEKEFFNKQWAVVANLFAGKNLLMVTLDQFTGEKNMVKAQINCEKSRNNSYTYFVFNNYLNEDGLLIVSVTDPIIYQYKFYLEECLISKTPATANISKD